MIAARLASDRSSGRVIGLFFAGLGPGIVVTGALIPIAFASDEGWRITWLVMGALTAAVAPLLLKTLRELDPAAADTTTHQSQRASSAADGSLLWLEVAYFLYGLGGVGYMTFAVARLREQSVSSGGVAAFWILMGGAVWLAGRLWAEPISRSSSGRLSGLMYSTMALAATVIAISGSIAAVMFSALAFGSVFVAAVSATTHLIRRHLPAHRWTAVLARFTVGFGVAMTIGAAAIGVIADAFSLTIGISASAGVLVLAAMIAFVQPDPDRVGLAEEFA